MSTNYKYHAFISYSHKDTKWADWLIKSLESFKIPKQLKGTLNKDGEQIPTSLRPIFRDREELPTRADLGDVINDSLIRSHYLIVICSPNSTKSMWVDQEIQTFKKIHGEHKVLAIIVDGEPNATDFHDNPDNEAFPKALRYKVDKNGELTDERTEPLAADAREHGDGKERSTIKLVAGLLGVGFNDLWQREQRRLKKQRMVLGSIAASVFTTVSALGIFSAIQWDKAEVAKIEAVEAKDIAVKAREGEEIQKKIVEEKLVEANHNLGLVYKQIAEAELDKGYLESARLFNLTALKFLKKDNVNTRYKVASSLNGSPSHIKSSLNIKSLNKQNIVLSPDGTKIASIEVKGSIVIRDANNGEEVQRLKNKLLFNYSFLKFSADGTKIAATTGKTVTIWSVQSGKELHIFRGHKEDVDSIAFSLDSTRIISSSGNKFVKVWNVETGKEIRTLKSNQTSYALSSNGRKAVSVFNNEITVWDINSGKKILTLKGHNEFVTAVAFTSDDKKIVSASIDQSLKIWNVKNGELLQSLKGHNNPIETFSFSSNGTKIVSATKERIKVWDLESGQEIYNIKTYKTHTEHVSFTADNRKIISVDRDGAVKTWKINSLSIVDHKRNFYIQNYNKARAVSYLEQDEIIKIWDLNTGKRTHILKEHGGLSSFSLSPDGTKFVSASNNGTIKLWDTYTGKIIKTIINSKIDMTSYNEETRQMTSGLDDDEKMIIEENRSLSIYGLGFSPDGTKIVFSSRKVITIWDVSSGKPIHTLRGHKDSISQISFIPDGTKIISSSYDTLIVWDVKTGKEIKRISALIGVFALSPDGTKIISMLNASSWDIVSGKQIPKLITPEGRIFSIAFSSDGTKIISSSEGIVNIWDINSGKVIQQIKVDNNQFIIASFLSDGDIVFSNGSGILKIWGENIEFTYDKTNDSKLIDQEIKKLESFLDKKVKGLKLVDIEHKNKLSDKSLKNLYLCEKATTGMKKFSQSLLAITKNLTDSGIKTFIYRLHEKLIMKISAPLDVEFELKKVDSGDLIKFDTICYEVQSVKTEGEVITRHSGEGELMRSYLIELGLFGELRHIKD